MSIFKKIGRSLRKVVDGAKKVLQTVGKGVKKVAKSPFGKMLLVAAGAYFGVPAIMGAFGGGAAALTGASGLAGALEGISGAWSGLTGAASAVMSGNFSGAASSLANGFLGGGTAAAPTIAPELLTSDLPVSNNLMTVAANSPAAATPGINPALARNVAQQGGSSLLGSALAQGTGAAIQAAGGMYASKAEAEAAQKMKAEELKRYNRNMGTNLFNAAQPIMRRSSFADRFSG